MPGPKLYELPNDIPGVPTRAELGLYPNRFTWDRLKEIVQSGELGDLKRAPELQKRYGSWYQGILAQYGTTESYLFQKRLPWRGIPETISSPISSIPSSGITTPTPRFDDKGFPINCGVKEIVAMPPPADGDEDGYLRWEGGQELVEDVYAILPNDWPYDVPEGVQHVVVWSRLPIFHPALIDRDPTKWTKLSHEGFAGFTGMGSLDWFTEGGQEVARMVADLWNVEEFECIWFVNPPRLQSVRGVSHYHVFVRSKARTGPEGV